MADPPASNRPPSEHGAAPQDPKAPRYLDDLVIGEILHTGSHRVSCRAMIDFAASFDPQPMHLDEHAGRESIFGELIASGWYTLSLTMRLMVDARPFGSTPLVGVHLKNITFTQPVLPDMVLRAQAKVTELRPSKSKPQQGLAGLHVQTFDEANRQVAAQDWLVLLPTRRAANPPSD